MKFIKLTEQCFYFHAAVNIGYIKSGRHGMLIDAGLDQQAAKKVSKQLTEHDCPLTHLFITHAHADHYGGAAFIQEKHDVHTFAAKEEAAILRNPILEPLYLFQGNKPLPELRNKFLEGTPISINEEVKEGIYQCGDVSFECIAFPGHSLMQLGVKADGILFAADSYFGMEQLRKHKIPYIIDADDTIISLEKLLTIDCKGAVPGHGIYEETFQETVSQNVKYHQHVLSVLSQIISEGPISQEKLVQKMCRHFDVNPQTLSSWLLFRTAITAYVTKLIKEKKAQITIEDASLYFKC
ncbi:MBL fold metallo-hydrolase [Metabacillus idriensis]|uniref:MBL fold metallo-hydrolase n=1 Tax=Metabacillus idriensis TaxID=324768 RepID=UPI00174E585A|nr:MBL fold metallo-hydrolase [Metabacillus idriensis]